MMIMMYYVDLCRLFAAKSDPRKGIPRFSSISVCVYARCAIFKKTMQHPDSHPATIQGHQRLLCKCMLLELKTCM